MEDLMKDLKGKLEKLQGTWKNYYDALVSYDADTDSEELRERCFELERVDKEARLDFARAWLSAWNSGEFTAEMASELIGEEVLSQADFSRAVIRYVSVKE